MEKIILITGASSGFGEAAARKFASDGCRLVLAARRIDKLQKLAEELQDLCPVYAAAMDVTSQESVEQFFKDLPQAFRDIDVLVNSAGLALGLEPAHEANFAQWQTMIDTNITGLLRVTHAVLPSMVARDTGHIINLGSTAGNWPYPGGNAYGATKAFVQNFSRALRADLLGKHVRVTNIEPGLAETEFSTVRFNGDTEKADKVYAGTKPLSAQDIAEIIHWVHAMPAHVNVNTLEVMPVCQAWSSLSINRNMEPADQ